MKTFDLGAVTAYALAVQNGFKGTLQEWLDSLVGKTPNLTIGKVETLEPGSNATATIGGTPESPVLNLGLPRGENGHAADLAQNDPTAPDYVKNRTHYEDKQVVEVLAETTTDGILNDALPVVSGNKYVVKWNGTEYECIASNLDYDGIPCTALGNLAEFTGVDTGEPFNIVAVPADMVAELELGALVTIYDDSTSVTLSIYQDNTTIVPLPAKYLPEGVPCIEEGMVEILPEYTITEENADADIAAIPALGLVAGNTYVVKLNGTEYSCVAWGVTQDGINVVGLGDIYTSSGGNIGTIATGEPFVLIEFPPEVAAEMGANVMCSPLSDDITPPIVLFIYGKVETFHKLDNRCLDLEWLPITTPPQTIYSSALTLDGFQNIGDKITGQAFDIENVLPLVEGETYSVTWNGVVYECIAQPVNGESACSLGNYALISTTNDNDTGEPFYIIAGTISGVGSVTGFYGQVTEEEKNAGSTVNRTVAIAEEGGPNKMPAEFLPDDATELYLTSSGGKKFKITVSDDGALSAAEVTS